MLEHRPSIKYFLELRTDAGDYLLENSRDYTFQRVSCKRQNFFVYLSRGGSSLGAKGLESRGAHQVTRRPACPDSHLDRLCYFDDNRIIYLIVYLCINLISVLDVEALLTSCQVNNGLVTRWSQGG